MRSTTRFIPCLLLTGLVCGSTSPAHATRLPEKLAYTFFLGGQRVGHADIRVTSGSTALLFESNMKVQLGPGAIALHCRTEADPRTFVVRRFSFEGTKGGKPVAAEVAVQGDTATGWTEVDGHREPRVATNPGGYFVFEDWVMELEVLLALHQAQSDKHSDTYRVLFANSFLETSLLAGYSGESLVEAPGRSLAARKLEVAMQGGSPFQSLVDPATGVPTYLQFPGVKAEAFLDSFFGKNPESRYPAPAADSTGR
jgi:hypothetical protein